MFDVILDWWEDLRLQTKLFVFTTVFTGMTLMSTSWTVMIGSQNIMDEYLFIKENQVILNTKEKFYKSYTIKQEKQVEQSRYKDKLEDKPLASYTELREFTQEGFEFIGIDSPRIPYYIQGDSRWGSYPVRGGTIANSGCGLTSMAMIKSYLTNSNVTPVDIYESLLASDFQGSMGWEAPAHIFEPMGYEKEHSIKTRIETLIYDNWIKDN